MITSGNVRICLFIIAALVLLATVPAVLADEQGERFTGVIELPTGTPYDLQAEGVQRYLIGIPSLATVERTGQGLRVTGQRPGTTVLAVWTPQGRSAYQLRVSAAPGEPKMEKIGLSVLEPQDLTIQPGESHYIKGNGVTKTAVSDPDVLDIVPVSDTEVLANAKKEGRSTVRVWDKDCLKTINFTVAKKLPTPEEVSEQVTKQIGISGISARLVNDTLVVTGNAPTADIAQKIGIIAESCGHKVVNMVNVQPVTPESVITSLKAALPNENLLYQILPDQTIMIKGAVGSEPEADRIEQMISAWTAPLGANGDRTSVTTLVDFNNRDNRVEPDSVDKNHTVARAQSPGDVEVGEEWNFSRRVAAGRIPNGPKVIALIEVNPSLAKQLLVVAQVIEIDRARMKEIGLNWRQQFGSTGTDPIIITEDRTPPVPLDEAGPFVRENLIRLELRALIEEGAARVLSEPKVLIADGHAANILVGGELPIPIAQNQAIGSTAITVEFKPFGIQLTVRPKITPDCRILLTLSPEVSQVDRDLTRAVRSGDFVIPALKTTRATTTVHIGNAETVAIGGLFSVDDRKEYQRLPLLSDIPIIGELFKSIRFVRNETELVILVTPQIVEPGATVPIPRPKE